MMSNIGTHLEIEHKFVLDPGFDRDAFFHSVTALQPLRTYSAQVVERYYLTEATPRLIYRHRYDENNQDLTYKTFGGDDIEIRREVRLSLDLRVGNQSESVRAFLEPLGLTWQGGLNKDLQVFNFADCEVVYYEARTAEKTVTCVEFEALLADSVEAALATLASYEQRLGFGNRQRSRRSLFELLFRDATGGTP